MIRPAWISVLVSAVGGCTAGSHQPARLDVERSLDADDFDAIVGLLLERGFRPLDIDAEAQKLSSDWIDTDTPRRPGLRRLHLDVVTEDRIELLVEVKWLRLGVFNDPYWTVPEVDYAEERELLESLESLLES